MANCEQRVLPLSKVSVGVPLWPPPIPAPPRLKRGEEKLRKVGNRILSTQKIIFYLMFPFKNRLKTLWV